MRRFSSGLVPSITRRTALSSTTSSQLASSCARNNLYRHYAIIAANSSRRDNLSSFIASASPVFTALSSQIQPLLRSSFHPSHRSYSQSFRQSPNSSESPNPRPGEGDSTAKADDAAKDSPKAQPSPDQPEAEGEKAKTQGEQGEEGADGEKGEKSEQKKKEDAPPPPKYGDKTPWQVFTDTLRSEFKASKEWNESTKELSSGYQEFTQNPNVQKATTAYTKSRDAATTATATAFKTTGKVIGQSAAWTWDTPVVKGIRHGVNAAGRGVEKATRPVRETEAFKSVKQTLDDGSSSRYGGWTEKEERRKQRELRELNELQRTGGKRLEKMEEDPDAGTNVTLHKDAAWKESWRTFRDSSSIMQGFFSMKKDYAESENPVIATVRSISDRVTGFFAENETAQVIKKFREMDPNFKMEPFLTEMREYILPEVLDAYVKGDVETLKLWLSAAQYQVYAALMQQYTTAGLKSDGRILDIRHVDVLSARMVEPGEIPVFIITCRTQEVHVYRNKKSGELAAGMDDRVQQVTYVIGVTRIPEDVSNPETRGWRMIELHKSARDYL